jgi:hypothetical protein
MGIAGERSLECASANLCGEPSKHIEICGPTAESKIELGHGCRPDLSISEVHGRADTGRQIDPHIEGTREQGHAAPLQCQHLVFETVAEAEVPARSPHGSFYPKSRRWNQFDRPRVHVHDHPADAALW